MKKLLLVIFFIFFVKADFETSVFLKDIKKINTINIVYKDTYGNKQNKSIDLYELFDDDLLIFSETKQNTFFKDIKLNISDEINSLEIEYLNKNNEKMNKFVGISLKERAIKSNNVYLYKNKDYTYANETMTEKKYIDKVHKTKKKVHIKNKKLEKLENSMTNNLLLVDIKDEQSYANIMIRNCENRHEVCDDPKISSYGHKFILKFKFCKQNPKKIDISNNIKKIRVVCDKREYPTHLVIDTKNKISKYKKLMPNNPKELKYRIEF